MLAAGDLLKRQYGDLSCSLCMGLLLQCIMFVCQAQLRMAVRLGAVKSLLQLSPNRVIYCHSAVASNDPNRARSFQKSLHDCAYTLDIRMNVLNPIFKVTFHRHMRDAPWQSIPDIMDDTSLGVAHQTIFTDCALTGMVPGLPDLQLLITEHFSTWLCHTNVCRHFSGRISQAWVQSRAVELTYFGNWALNYRRNL